MSERLGRNPFGAKTPVSVPDPSSEETTTIAPSAADSMPLLLRATLIELPAAIYILKLKAQLLAIQ